MNWTQLKQDLLKNKIVKARLFGNSMTPKINDGDLVILDANCKDLAKNDVVFCKVGRNYHVHLITAIRNDRYQISNNKGHVNGWIGKNNIFAKVIGKE